MALLWDSLSYWVPFSGLLGSPRPSEPLLAGEESTCVDENVNIKKRKIEMPTSLTGTQRPQSATPVDRCSGRLQALEALTSRWEPSLEERFQRFRVEWNPLIARIDQLQQEQIDLMSTLRLCTARIDVLEEMAKENTRTTPLAIKKGRKPLPHITIPVEDAHYMAPTGTPAAPRKETKVMWGEQIVDLSALAAKPSAKRAPSLTPSVSSSPSLD